MLRECHLMALPPSIPCIDRCYILRPVRGVKNINTLVSKCKQITSLIKCTTKMVRNYTSNGIQGSADPWSAKKSRV